MTAQGSRSSLPARRAVRVGSSYAGQAGQQAKRATGQSPNFKSPIRNESLHRLLRLVSRRGLSAAGKLSLAFLFYVGFLSRLNRSLNRTGLTHRGAARCRSNLARLSGRGIVQLSRAFTSGFVIFAGRFTRRVVNLACFGAAGVIVFFRFRPQLLRGFSRFIDSLSPRIGDIVPQLPTGLTREQ